jgi:hypothetical protein
MAGIRRGGSRGGSREVRGQLGVLTELMANELTFMPTPEQRKLKSSFWHRFGEDTTNLSSDITLELVDSYVPDDRLPKWWQEPGFKEWMRNPEEFRERIEYLVFLAMDTLENLLIDRSANANAKVSAAKLLMEVGRKMPPKVMVEKYLDEKIGEMDKGQLEEYIRKNVKLVKSDTSESQS